MTIINQRYKLIDKIGSGCFGTIFKAKDIQNDIYVAVKIESKKSKKKRLSHEIRIYQNLISSKYHSHFIPRILWYGNNENHNFLVMEYMGYNLEKIFLKHKHSFTLKTIIMLTIDLLNALQFIHHHNVIHRDLKPDNIVISHQNQNVYLLDFGLSKNFINGENQKHLKLVKNKSLVGSVRYASIRNHKGYEISRRDDLESLAYILLYLFKKGKLPWNGLPISDKEEKNKQILNIKKNIPIKELCKDIPQEYQTLLSYSRKLKFEQKPNYDYLIHLFHKLLNNSGFKYDQQYDWIK